MNLQLWEMVTFGQGCHGHMGTLASPDKPPLQLLDSHNYKKCHYYESQKVVIMRNSWSSGKKVAIAKHCEKYSQFLQL